MEESGLAWTSYYLPETIQGISFEFICERTGPQLPKPVLNKHPVLMPLELAFAQFGPLVVYSEVGPTEFNQILQELCKNCILSKTR